MCRTSHRGQGSPWPGGSVLGSVLTPPCYSRVGFVDIGLGLGAGVSGYGVEVVGEGDVGFVDVFVVGAEHDGVDFGVGLVGYVVEGWGPFL